MKVKKSLLTDPAVKMPKRVPLLLLSGSMGAGKTTVMGEVSDLLQEADIPHATLDFDCLAQIHPRSADDRYGSRLAFQNLAAIWPNYRLAGIDRLVIARVVEEPAELDRYRAAIPGCEPVVCRITAPVETMHDRLRQREPGIYLPKFLARSTELDGILRSAAIEDFTVDNGPERNITEVAREVLDRAGWR